MAVSVPAAGAAQERHALVVGNGAYGTLPALPGCPTLAKTVASHLRTLDFQTVEVMDVSNGEMGGAINRFYKRLVPDAIAVVYVCGHAVGWEGRGFLIPARAKLDRTSQILTEGIIATSLPNLLDRSDLRFGLVILDLSEPFLDQEGAMPFSLPPPPSGVGTIVATIASPGAPGAVTTAVSSALEGETVELGTVLATAGTSVRGDPARKVVVEGGPREQVVLRAPVTAVSPPASAAVPAPTADQPEPPAEPASAETADEGEAQLSSADRRRIQLRLWELKLYAGAIDGAFGRGTRAAIRAYQKDSGEPGTGVLTSSQIRALLAVPESGISAR